MKNKAIFAIIYLILGVIGMQLCELNPVTIKNILGILCFLFAGMALKESLS